MTALRHSRYCANKSFDIQSNDTQTKTYKQRVLQKTKFIYQRQEGRHNLLKIKTDQMTGLRPSSIKSMTMSKCIEETAETWRK